MNLSENVGNDPCVVPNGNTSDLCRNDTGVVPYDIFF